MEKAKKETDDFSTDSTTGATVCAQLQAAGQRSLKATQRKPTPPPGITEEEMMHRDHYRPEQ